LSTAAFGLRIGLAAIVFLTNGVAAGSVYAVPVVLTKSAYCFGSSAKLRNYSTISMFFVDFATLKPSR
jgi:hypothetical protein